MKETARYLGATRFRRVLLLDLELVDYFRSAALRNELQKLRITGEIPDSFMLLEHPPTITPGAGGAEGNPASEDWLTKEGFEAHRVEGEAGATCHGPGQLVVYPVLSPNNYQRDNLLVYYLEEAMARTLAAFGISGHRKEGSPGVWVDGLLIAGIGFAGSKGDNVRDFFLNINPDLSHLGVINPFRLTGVEMTSITGVLGRPVSVHEVKSRFIEEMAGVLQWESILPGGPVQALLGRLGIEALSLRPDWLSVSPPAPGTLDRMAEILRRGKLHTVCEGACCPNAAECFGMGTATFMILGDTCTRNCRFCSVKKGVPRLPDSGEPQSVARTVRELGLTHVVVTSVTRDDLPDGGARHFAGVINAVRSLNHATTVEVLVPDFQGSETALARVTAARPNVLGHNVETVPRLYGRVQPRADYRRSLDLLETAKRLAPEITTKSGIMVGLGEEPEEVLAVMDDLRAAGCDYMTLGQYLQPTPGHLPVEGFVTPAMFAWYKEQCIRKGFRKADCGPLVRSSYHARPLDRA